MDSCGVLIVGAGLSGLSAARRLIGEDFGFDPKRILIVDKGRGVGGRLATRRIAGAHLDHGAQFFTVRSAELQADVEKWLAAGVVEEWCRGFAEVDGYPRYRVAGGMKELARSLANELTEAGVTITTDLRIEAITPQTGTSQAGTLQTGTSQTGTSLAGTEHHGGAWSVSYTDDTEPTSADSLIVTPPIPQTLELLAAGATTLAEPQATMLADFAYHRVIALLTVLDGPAGLAEPGALQQPNDPVFSFVADNQAKGISAEPAVTFHTAHDRSAELWPESDERVAELLLPEASRLLAPASIVEFNVKRWLYSGPVTPHPDPCLIADVLGDDGTEPEGGLGRLVLAGDGFGGSKVEGAYLSGRAAAAAVMGS